MTTVATSTLEPAVLAALGRVRDPELDESIVALGFAQAELGDDGSVRIHLRLPTFWCSPNFAYLMAEDARSAVAAVPGVTSVELRLVDHFADEAVTAGVNGDLPFEQAFAGQATEGLAELRSLFARKAFLVRQERLVRELLAGGRSEQEVASLRLSDVPESSSELAAPCLERRAELGIGCAPGDPLVVTAGGEAVGSDRLPLFLRQARLTRISIETNTVLCTALLATRKHDRPDEEVTQ